MGWSGGFFVSAGWSSPVARQAHNLKVAGSNPAPATKLLFKARFLAGFLHFEVFLPDTAKWITGPPYQAKLVPDDAALRFRYMHTCKMVLETVVYII